MLTPIKVITIKCPLCHSLVDTCEDTETGICPACGDKITVDSECIATLPPGAYNKKPPKELRCPRSDRGNLTYQLQDSYVAIDLETTGLDPFYDSIIEIAAVRVEAGVVVDKFSTLINPHYELSDFITNLTGITDSMLASAPDISKVLPELDRFIGDSILLGHNVSFDVAFLYDYYKHLYNKPFINNYMDTMRIARRLLPGLPSYCLHFIADALGVDMPKTMHRAESDCLTAIECYKALTEIIDREGIDINNRITYRKPRKKGLSASEILPTVEDICEDNILYGKEMVFTGTLSIQRKDAMQLAVNKGAVCKDSITAQTNILVLGDLTYNPILRGKKSSKQKRAEQMLQEGKDIQIISESVFFDMLDD